MGHQSRLGAGLVLLVAAMLTTSGFGPRAQAAQMERPVARAAQTGRAASASVSPFAIRGVIEGYYGYSWSVAQTADILAFMGAHGMNTFVYAPKFDPYERAEWNKPYPPAQLASLAAMVHAAQRAGVDFVYSLSPGLSIVYSSPVDRAAVEAKFAQLRGIGVHTFMLSFDDVSDNLASPADRQAYGNSISRAQTALTNAIYASEIRSDPRFRLFFTPTDYWGTTPSIYFTHISHLNPAIDVVWTGPGVVSPTITAAQADAIARLIGRPPLIWYNYPVNDWTVPTKELEQDPQHMQPQDMFLGPVKGLAPNLGTHVRGLLANPMIEPFANEVPLATIAAYLNHPASYRPDPAWTAAIAAVAGREAGPFATFARALSPYPEILPVDRWYWTTTDAPADGLETAVLTAFAHDPAATLRAPAADALRTTFAAWVDDAPALGHLPNPALSAEIAPWVHWMALEGGDGLDAMALLHDLALHSPAAVGERLRVLADARALNAAPVQFGGNLEGFLTQVAKLR